MKRATTARLLVPALVLGAALGGCSDIYYDRREGVAFHAGDAVESNKVTQIIDPWPRAAADRHIPADGQRMQGAVQRYRENKAPAAAPPAATLSIQTGGGSN